MTGAELPPPITEYTKTFEIRWADVDPNQHARHSVYTDYATHVRFSYLAENGFDAQRLQALSLGPVVLFDETRYRREVRLGARIRIDFQAAGLSPSAGRWKARHTVYREDGKIVVVHTLAGGWLDLRQRRMVQPPEELAALLRRLPRAKDYADLDERGRAPGDGMKRDEEG